jgi:thiosulfate dehydrogenase [quinone] large subunit
VDNDNTLSALSSKYSGAQIFFLTCLRVIVGWHFLYEGWVKVAGSGWSAAGYLRAAPGPFGGLFGAIAGVSWMAGAIDIIMSYGLLLIGLSLMLGLYTRIGYIAAGAFLFLFYISNPPLVGVKAMAGEGNYLIVNKNLVELAAVMVLMFFPVGSIWGFDRLFMEK